MPEGAALGQPCDFFAGAVEHKEDAGNLLGCPVDNGKGSPLGNYLANVAFDLFF